MQTQLQIFFRHKQIYNMQNIDNPVIVQCNADGTTEYVPGTVPGQDWVDMTEYTEGLDEFKLSWTAQTDDFSGSDSDISQFGSNYSKGLTDDFTFFGAAFQYIYDWLMTEPCQMLNSIEVKIFDAVCQKQYRLFELKLDNISYAPVDEPCIVKIALREADAVWHSFQTTIIEDNWQNWFNKENLDTGKVHPTFSFIVEKKPKFFLAIFVVLIYVVGMLSTGILIALDGGKEWIRKTLGFTYFCPSPLIRTYIENICMKFGYTFDTIFDDVETNPYRDLCLFWPASTAYKNFAGFETPNTLFIWDNRTVLSFAKFLNQLKKVFNAEWYVTPNKQLVFKHKSFFDKQDPVYDFTAPGSDQLIGLKYTFNGKKKPAYGDYSYQIDPIDSCANEVKWRYDAIVDYDGGNDNPMLEGHISKMFDFSMTAFQNDGSSREFIKDAVLTGRLIAVAALIVGLGELFAASNFITVAIVTGLLTIGYIITNDYVNNFFESEELNGMVRTASSELNMPRLLLWDRNTPVTKAKVVSVVNPAINPYYNTVPVDYYQEHPTYDTPGIFGTEVVKVYNYPMYIDEMFTENLYDRFHEYDNPLKNPVINQTWEGTVQLCCEWLDRLGVWENDFVKIGGVVILEDRNGRKIKGRITEIDPSYKTGTINLKGDVLK